MLLTINRECFFFNLLSDNRHLAQPPSEIAPHPTSKPSPTSTETKTVLHTDRALRETTAGMESLNHPPKSRFYTIQASSRYVGRPVVNARWMPLSFQGPGTSSSSASRSLQLHPPALSRSTIPSSNLWTTQHKTRALEQLAMGIQKSYQSASMTFTLRRQTRIHLLSQLSSETPSFSV
ncbi:hypothetical protein CCUS01_02405 [Colletotrichum cuscutae]|uniref:Uncharacterized protein n=1 Tax=Colletotrichum cuscutae TaxID=1209917 RepID=A0AAI9XEV2_9PEZI|nr:hypothetical protein CCUS01_02405 [Colletotrichum cuscutae]